MSLTTRVVSLRPILRLGAAAMLAMAMTAACRADSNYLIDVWTPYDGLPQSQVMSIAQTPDGYLWISTKLGWLARFDGFDFDHFNSANTPALGSPEIQKLLVDDRGTLWIADIDGRLISHSGRGFENHAAEKPGYRKRVVEWIGRQGEESRFVTAYGFLLRTTSNGPTSYENETNLPPPNPASIALFRQDGNGILWCLTQGGMLGRWMNGKFVPVPEEDLPGKARIHDLLPSPDGGLWIATSEGLWMRSNGLFSASPDGHPASHRPIYQLDQSRDGKLWILGEEGLALLHDGRVTHSYPLPDLGTSPLRRPLEMHADSAGGVWLVKYGQGVWHIDGEGTLTMLSTRNGLPSDLIETWFEDREKNIWLGTAAGLVRLRPRWFQIVETHSAGLGTGVVSICEDAGGDIWLGRANGLTRLRNGRAEDIPLGTPRPGFPVAEVTIAPGDGPGEVWLGSVQSGGMRLRDERIEHPFPFERPGLAIRVIRRDPEGGIWFGGEFGLFRWDGKSLRKFGPGDGLSPGHIHDISFDEDGTPWIAKAEDLLVVYRDGRFEPVAMPGLSRSMRIYTVLCGKDGNVWLGTVGAGLLHLSQGKLYHYTTEDGLPADSVAQLLEDDHGFLWGGTLQGIFRASITALDMRTKGVRPPVLFQNYGHADGLPSAECSGGLQPACWKTRDGRLWFSTSTSAVVVDPGRIEKLFVPPAVIIENMRVNGADVGALRNDGREAARRLSPGRHRYEFLFTGLSFTAPEKLNFQWRLDGVDTDWVDGKKQRAVAYSGLDPGNYQFAVRAANSDGVWSREPATIDFQVPPFFWQRASVRVGLAIGLLAVAYLAIAGVMRRKHLRELRYLEYERSLEQQRFRHKQAMESERSRIAAELHDDLGANLTQIQWLGEATGGNHRSATDDRELLLRIARKSREMVRLIDQIVWAVNPNNDNLEQLVTYICNFAEQYFRDSATRCRIDVADGIPAQPLKADVRHHLFLIAKEALHNVAKHAGTDRVWIRMSDSDGVFKLVIEDRGKGFAVTSESGGNGLNNMRRRAEQAGAQLDVKSAPQEGTQVRLLFKLDPPTT